MTLQQLVIERRIICQKFREISSRKKVQNLDVSRARLA